MLTVKPAQLGYGSVLLLVVFVLRVQIDFAGVSPDLPASPQS